MIYHIPWKSTTSGCEIIGFNLSTVATGCYINASFALRDAAILEQRDLDETITSSTDSVPIIFRVTNVLCENEIVIQIDKG